MFQKLFIPLTLVATLFAGLPASLKAETVTCSYYSLKYNGRRSASGQIFSNDALTAASKTLPFGTRVKLTNPKNGRSVIVRVNDRGPFVAGRDISVTRRAAQRLHMMRAGVMQLEMENLSGGEPAAAKPAPKSAK